MSEFEISIDIPENLYGECIIIEKYHDRYSLVLGKKGEGAKTVFKKWVYPQIGKDKAADKAIPLKIPLGAHADAVEVIKQIAKAFNLKVASVDADDIPF